MAEIVNQDPEVSADLSEPISTAGKEASGTGNMKFTMNGALTNGTLDGANVEIRDAVGPENFFLFGLTADEVTRLNAAGYAPRSFYDSNPDLRPLLTRDEYRLLADYQAYGDCQPRVSDVYRDQDNWTRVSNSTRPASVGSRQIGRSATTAGTSGT